MDLVPPVRPIVVASTSVAHRDDLDVPRGLRVAAAWAWRVLLLLIVGAAVLWLAGKLQVVVVPILIATLLSALLSPLVGLLRRATVPRSLASTLVLIGGIVAVGGTLYLVISQFISGAPQLSSKAAAGIKTIQDWLKTGPLHLSDAQLQSLAKEAQDWFTNNQGTLTTGALSTATTLGHVLTGVFLVLFTTFFFLRDGRRISRFAISLLPEKARERMTSAAEVSWATLVSYVRATVLVAFIDALGIGLALIILDVPFPFPLAALVFIGAFIPIVGATVSGAVAVLVALVDGGPVVALILLAAVIAVQQLEGHVLQPLIMGRAVAIHPLAVILAIACGIVLAGIIGALIAVPIVAVLNTGIRHLAAVRRAEENGEPPPGTPAPTGPPAPAARSAPPLVRKIHATPPIVGPADPTWLKLRSQGVRGQGAAGAARSAASVARRLRAPSTTSGFVVYQNGGNELRRKLPYPRAVSSRESSTATTPRSEDDRMSRPTPWARRMAAIGTLTAAKPDPPAASTAADRAAASGSSGRGNGNRSITTSWHASPGTSTPCQSDMTPSRQLVGSARNRLTSNASASSPWTRISKSVCARSTSAARCAARREENSPSVRPPERVDQPDKLLGGRLGQPGRGGPGQVRRHVQDALAPVVER